MASLCLEAAQLDEMTRTSEEIGLDGSCYYDWERDEAQSLQN